MAQTLWCSRAATGADDAEEPDVVASTGDAASVDSPRKPVGGCGGKRRSSGCLARTVVTVATSTSNLEGMDRTGHRRAARSRPDFAGGPAPSLGWALRGVAALPRECVGGLRAAIGPPPRRPLEDPRAPSGLLWAADVAVVLVALSTALFALSFVGNGCEEGIGDQVEAENASPRLSSPSSLAMYVIAAICGGLLNMQHSLVPAVLCNI